MSRLDIFSHSYEFNALLTLVWTHEILNHTYINPIALHVIEKHFLKQERKWYKLYDGIGCKEKSVIFCILTVGKLKENSLESVMIRIGGATKFLTDRIITSGIKQITDRMIAT